MLSVSFYYATLAKDFSSEVLCYYLCKVEPDTCVTVKAI